MQFSQLLQLWSGPRHPLRTACHASTKTLCLLSCTPIPSAKTVTSASRTNGIILTSGAKPSGSQAGCSILMPIAVREVSLELVYLSYRRQGCRLRQDPQTCLKEVSALFLLTQPNTSRVCPFQKMTTSECSTTPTKEVNPYPSQMANSNK